MDDSASTSETFVPDPRMSREDAAVALIQDFAGAEPAHSRNEYGQTAEGMIAKAQQFLRDYPESAKTSADAQTE